MTPEYYNKNVLPKLCEKYHNKCICGIFGLRNIISFNFRNYNIGPVALADSEILIQELLRSGNICYERHYIKDRGYDFICKICGNILREMHDEFSINMSHSYIENENSTHDMKLYLIGFYGLQLDEIDRIKDYQKTDNIDKYLQYINSAQQGNAPERASPTR